MVLHAYYTLVSPLYFFPHLKIFFKKGRNWDEKNGRKLFVELPK